MHVMLPTPSLRGETHACENITCPKLLLRPVIMSTFFPFFATWMSVGTSLMGDNCNNMETEIYFWGSGLFHGRRFVAEAQVCFWGAGLFLRHRSVSEAQVCFWVGCLFLRRRSFSEAWIQYSDFTTLCDSRASHRLKCDSQSCRQSHSRLCLVQFLWKGKMYIGCQWEPLARVVSGECSYTDVFWVINAFCRGTGSIGGGGARLCFYTCLSFCSRRGGGVYPSMQWGRGSVSQHAMGQVCVYPSMQLGRRWPGGWV